MSSFFMSLEILITKKLKKGRIDSRSRKILELKYGDILSLSPTFR
jgi:hypothetical protein